MLKIRQIILLCTLVALCACSSDKKRIQTYIDNFHPDSEIEIDGDVVVDSAFCPLAALDSASLVLLSHRMNLLGLLDVNPDSAFALARQLNQKYTDSSFANIAYPKGPHNCLSYQVKCVVDGRERYVVFFKKPDEDVIEASSIEVDEAIDSLMKPTTKSVRRPPARSPRLLPTMVRITNAPPNRFVSRKGYRSAFKIGWCSL